MFMDAQLEKRPRVETMEPTASSESVENALPAIIKRSNIWKELEIFRKYTSLRRSLTSDGYKYKFNSIEESSSVPFDIIEILNHPEALREWCQESGLVHDLRKCPLCSSSVEWKVLDGQEYWVCSSGSNSDCVPIPVNGAKFGGLSVRKLIILIYMWDLNSILPELCKRECIKHTEYLAFGCAMSLVSLYASQELSQKIGGRKVKVLVEIHSTNIQEQPLIFFGIEVKNIKKFFVAFLDREKISPQHLKEEMDKYIEHGSIVFSRSRESFLECLKWHSYGQCPVGADIILGDTAWRGYLSECQNPLFEISKTIGLFCRYF